MFGWRTTPDRDAVAAAQRRLAAVAAQFTTSEERRAATDGAAHGGALDETPADGAALDEAATADPGGSPRPFDAGRHAGRPVVRGDGRWMLSAHHVAVIALAALVMLAVATWWVLRSVPHSQPLQVSAQRSLPLQTAPSPTPPVTAGTPPVPTPTDGVPASATPTAELVIVDVAGKVRHPGIVELPEGSRVVDALGAAGGTRPGVDIRSLNLARVLVDGEQIVVGFDVPQMVGASNPVATSTPSSGASIQPVNLNTATAEQLDTLPGIGPVTAQAILSWRDENGAFTNVDELLEVSGIGDATLSDVLPYVYV